MIAEPRKDYSQYAESSVKAPEVARLKDRYLEALLMGDEDGAAREIDSAAALNLRPETIYMDVLARTMVSVGEIWRAGEITIAHEHQATQVTLRQARRLRQIFAPARLNGLHAVVSAIGSDAHLLGPTILADLLYFDGWDTDFLGAGIPPDALADVVALRTPDLIGLSATVPGTMESLEASVAAVRRASENSFVLIGGVTVSHAPARAASIGADLVAMDPVEAVREVGRIFDIRATEQSLSRLLVDVGSRIRKAREERGWSQRELSISAGLDRAYLSGVELGKRNLTLGAVLKIGSALDVSISDLIAWRGSL